MPYRWKTNYLKLTEEQKKRGVIYSSQLYTLNGHTDNNIIHEVFETDKDKHEKITRLKDVEFFKAMARQMGWKAGEIRRQ